jgi:hypothetical protein
MCYEYLVNLNSISFSPEKKGENILYYYIKQ